MAIEDNEHTIEKTATDEITKEDVDNSFIILPFSNHIMLLIIILSRCYLSLVTK